MVVCVGGEGDPDSDLGLCRCCGSKYVAPLARQQGLLHFCAGCTFRPHFISSRKICEREKQGHSGMVVCVGGEGDPDSDLGLCRCCGSKVCTPFQPASRFAAFLRRLHFQATLFQQVDL